MTTGTHPGWRRRRRRIGAVGVVVLLVVALGGCEQVIVDRVNQARGAAGQPALPTAQYLTEAARGPRRRRLRRRGG